MWNLNEWIDRDVVGASGFLLQNMLDESTSCVWMRQFWNIFVYFVFIEYGWSALLLLLFQSVLIGMSTILGFV